MEKDDKAPLTRRFDFQDEQAGEDALPAKLREDAPSAVKGGTDNLSALDDGALVHLFKSTGESRYFTELFERHSRGVYETCRRFPLSSGLLEDLVQDTFRRALEDLDQFDERKEDSHFASWLHTIARNCCLDIARKMQVRKRIHPLYPNGLEELESGKVTAAKSSMTHYDPMAFRFQQEQNVVFREVREELQKLKREYRICYLLFYVEGFSYEEIEYFTGFNFEEVKTYLRTARRHIEGKFNSKK